jgi:CRISPR-associated protein Cas2
MFLLICYDIADDRRRYRIERVLSDYGVRVQESVFEAHVTDKDCERLKGHVRKYMHHELDSVRYYALCRNCINAVEADGIGIEPDEDEETTIVL